MSECPKLPELSDRKELKLRKVRCRHMWRVLHPPSKFFSVTFDMYNLWSPKTSKNLVAPIAPIVPGLYYTILIVVNVEGSVAKCCDMPQCERVHAMCYEGVYTVIESRPHGMFAPAQKLSSSICRDSVVLDDKYFVMASAIA